MVGGVTLGVAAAATGVFAIAAGVGAAGFLLGSASVALGIGATALDYGHCVHGHETAACMGLGLGVTGTFTGAFGAVAALLPEESLAGAILGGVGAFGLNVGVTGTVFDGTIGLFGSDSATSGISSGSLSNSRFCGDR